MRVCLPLLLAVALGTQIAPASEVHWVGVASLTGSREWEVSSTYSISPDAQVLVLRRDEHRDSTRIGARRHELVYVELVTHQERSVLELPNSGYLRLGVSRDGRQVAVLRTLSGADWQPFIISIWHPQRSEEVLADYGYSCFELATTGAASESLQGTPFGDPAFSPDGTHVAFFARHFSQDTKRNEQAATDAVGVLDLESRTTVAFDLPFLSGSEAAHEWYLGWSEDGSSVYAVAQDVHRERIHEKTAAGASEARQAWKESTLYQCRLADGRIKALGPAPSNTLGFGQSDDILVASVDTTKGRLATSQRPATRFSLVPIARLEQSGAMGAASAQAVASGASVTESIILGDDKAFRLSAVFAGKTHTSVVGWIEGERVVLERVVSVP